MNSKQKKLMKIINIQRIISNYTAENEPDSDVEELLNFILEESLELQDLIVED